MNVNQIENQINKSAKTITTNITRTATLKTLGSKMDAYKEALTAYNELSQNITYVIDNDLLSNDNTEAVLLLLDTMKGQLHTGYLKIKASAAICANGGPFAVSFNPDTFEVKLFRV